MSDVKIENIVPKSIDNATLNVTDKPTKSIGTYIDDLLFLVLGGFHQSMEKRRIQYNEDLIKFENDVKQEISAIPPEKQIEPQTGLILSTLDAARYKVEEENLRKMFARTIANSMNSDYANYVHPSFVTIVKEMSSLDAENISLFKSNTGFPIAQYIVISKNHSKKCPYSNIFLSNPNNTDIKAVGVSISVLVKSGLVKVDYNKYLLSEDYNIFEHTPEFEAIQNQIDDVNQLLPEEVNKLGDTARENYDFLHGAKIEIQKGIIELTEMGKRFVEICV